MAKIGAELPKLSQK